MHAKTLVLTLALALAGIGALAVAPSASAHACFNESDASCLGAPCEGDRIHLHDGGSTHSTCASVPPLP